MNKFAKGIFHKFNLTHSCAYVYLDADALSLLCKPTHRRFLYSFIAAVFVTAYVLVNPSCPMYVFLHEVACFNEHTLTVVASGLHAEYIRYCLLWTFILVQVPYHVMPTCLFHFPFLCLTLSNMCSEKSC